MPGELTTAIGAIGDPEGVAELGLEGMAGVDRVVPISRPVQARLLASSATTSRRRSSRRPHGRRRRDVQPDRRAVHGRVARADARGRARGQGRRRVDAARRRVQAAHLAVRLQGPGRRGAGDPRRGARARPGCRSSPSCSTPRTPTRSPSTPTSCRSARATCRTTRCSRSRASSASRCCSSAGCRSTLEELLQAADYILKEGNEARHALRARHPHLRDRDALHARPRRGAVAEAAHPPAGDRRPVARRGRPPPGRAAVARGRRGRRRRHHRRGPRGSRAALCDGPQALSTSHFADYARDVAAHAALLGKRLA